MSKWLKKQTAFGWFTALVLGGLVVAWIIHDVVVYA